MWAVHGSCWSTDHASERPVAMHMASLQHADGIVSRDCASDGAHPCACVTHQLSHSLFAAPGGHLCGVHSGGMAMRPTARTLPLAACACSGICNISVNQGRLRTHTQHTSLTFVPAPF